MTNILGKTLDNSFLNTCVCSNDLTRDDNIVDKLSFGYGDHTDNSNDYVKRCREITNDFDDLDLTVEKNVFSKMIHSSIAKDKKNFFETKDCLTSTTDLLVEFQVKKKVFEDTGFDVITELLELENTNAKIKMLDRGNNTNIESYSIDCQTDQFFKETCEKEMLTDMKEFIDFGFMTDDEI